MAVLEQNKNSMLVFISSNADKRPRLKGEFCMFLHVYGSGFRAAGVGG